MLQPKGFWVLHAWYFPAIRPGPRYACHNFVFGTLAKRRIANYVTKIPDSLESADAAPMLCAGVTVYSALRKSGARSGDWIALLGAGGGVSILHLLYV
jgi:D-arabinose 1-dehydrogenase-like Zn-dependent alcohol dehydrogenase